MIYQKRTLVSEREGDHVWKHTITWFAQQFMPRMYTRRVRAPYTGEQLRELRAQRGVGTPPWKLEQRAMKLQAGRPQ